MGEKVSQSYFNKLINELQNHYNYENNFENIYGEFDPFKAKAYSDAMMRLQESFDVYPDSYFEKTSVSDDEDNAVDIMELYNKETPRKAIIKVKKGHLPSALKDALIKANKGPGEV